VDKLSTCGGIGLPPKKGKNKSIGNGFIFSLKINPLERIYFGIQKVKLIFIANYAKNQPIPPQVDNLSTQVPEIPVTMEPPPHPLLLAGNSLCCRCSAGVLPGLCWCSGVLLVFCWCSAGVLPVCCRCAAGMLPVCCWCAAGMLPVCCWCAAGVLLVFCWCSAGVLPVCCR
jgi:hypothetical protein